MKSATMSTLSSVPASSSSSSAARSSVARSSSFPVDVDALLAARPVALVACIGGTAMIASCYVTCIAAHECRVWLPMISDTFVFPPGRYISRVGMNALSMLLWSAGYLMFQYTGSRALTPRSEWRSDQPVFHPMRDRVAFWLLSAATTGMAVVGAVNERELSALHGFSAGVFFVFYAIYMTLTTTRLHAVRTRHPRMCDARGILPVRSLVAKYALTAFMWLSLVTFAVYAAAGWSAHATTIAIFEWLMVLAILLYYGSFAYEFASTLYFSVVVRGADADDASPNRGVSARLFVVDEQHNNKRINVNNSNDHHHNNDDDDSNNNNNNDDVDDECARLVH